MSKNIILLIFILSLFFPFQPAQAQDTGGPIYIVQPGDSLSSIAERFSVSLADLMAVNGIANANQLNAGDALIIPGLSGITGTLNTEVVNFGDSYRSLIRRTQVSETLFKKLNHVVSPSEFYVGVSMIVPVQSGETAQALRARLAYYKRKLGKSWRFNVDAFGNFVTVRRWSA